MGETRCVRSIVRQFASGSSDHYINASEMWESILCKPFAPYVIDIFQTTNRSLLPDNQPEMTEQASSSRTNPVHHTQQQKLTKTEKLVERERRRQEIAKQRLDLKNHRDIARSVEALDLYVQVGNRKISEADLRSHFASFGEVVHVSNLDALPEQGGRTQEIAKRKIHLQNHLAIARSQKALDIYVDGLRSEITEEQLSTHFAAFGKVLDVYRFYSTDKSIGKAIIAIQPTVDRKWIRRTKHIVNGFELVVRGFTSF
ncbi:unnamed protein product [Dibothriocephalus latus]|uniref:RRM domain-containing protein n=1 Tax=Dibothriocephalus latus TaxID=60516 RepID=A0A3P7NNA6_DIBLA|nr:unnamed protein product [Dibothriocephalus latus]